MRLTRPGVPRAGRREEEEEEEEAERENYLSYLTWSEDAHQAREHKVDLSASSPGPGHGSKNI